MSHVVQMGAAGSSMVREPHTLLLGNTCSSAALVALQVPASVLLPKALGKFPGFVGLSLGRGHIPSTQMSLDMTAAGCTHTPGSAGRSGSHTQPFWG